MTKKKTFEEVKKIFSDAGLTLLSASYKSNKKNLKFICNRGHVRSMSLSSILMGRGCKECSLIDAGKKRRFSFVKVVKFFNSQGYKILSAEKDYVNSHSKVEFECPKGHTDFMCVYHFFQGSRCPYCSNNKVCSDNCLAVLNPEVAKEWHPTKNGHLTPYDFTYGSSKKVWWLCSKCNNEWEAIIGNRTRTKNPTGCSFCLIGGSISKISQEWLDLLGIPVENREIVLPDLNYKVDAFVPETNTVYEFFGDYWHGNPDRFDRTQEHPVCKKTFGQLYEETKTRIFRLKTAGYLLVYVWEKDFKS